MTGIGSLEESPSQRLTGTYQERGREEEDGEKVEGGEKRQYQEKKHQNLQRDCGGQVSETVDFVFTTSDLTKVLLTRQALRFSS